MPLRVVDFGTNSLKINRQGNEKKNKTKTKKKKKKKKKKVMMMMMMMMIWECGFKVAILETFASTIEP